MKACIRIRISSNTFIMSLGAKFLVVIVPRWRFSLVSFNELSLVNRLITSCWQFLLLYISVCSWHLVLPTSFTGSAHFIDYTFGISNDNLIMSIFIKRKIVEDNRVSFAF